MPPSPPALTNSGSPDPVVKEAQRRFPGLEVTYRDEDIRIPTDWRIHDRQHSIIVHFAGRMDRLETELEGSGGSTGPALPGEIWTVPAGLDPLPK